MTPDDLRTLDELFDQAMDLAGVERDAFLRRVATEHPALVNRLRTLLDADSDDTFILDRPVHEHARFEDAVSSLDRIGTRVGPYQLVEHLGRGGMASVYLAERADGQWKNRVALKILHRGLDTEGIVRRFVEERQILSSLDHPNVARFLGGGTSEDGLPYLVMEYVEAGRSVVDWADANELGERERVELFIQAADAVQAAHARLVAHRDLKPSNVLVDSRGQVKLVDFGIAKLLDPGQDPGVTRAGQRVLTPAYASPEQLEGGDITTASDVYQLGLVLRELLPDGTVGDLGTIAGKALRPDPAERYTSAGALADDLRRYLDGLPVEARPDSLAYRAGKFVRRNRGAVAAAAVFVVSLAGTATVATVQAIRANQERDRARLEQLRAERVRDFVTDVLNLVDPDVAGDAALANRAILDASLERARLRLAGEPAVLGDVLGTIGELYTQLGQGEAAIPILEESVALLETEGGSVERRVEAWADLGFARLYWGNDHSGGIADYERAVAVARSELPPEHPLLAEALTGLAQFVRRDGELIQDTVRARRLLDEALAILRSQPAGTEQGRLASALYASGTLHERAPDDAAADMREALEIRRDLYGEVHTTVASTMNDLAMILETSDPVATDSLLARAIEIQAELFGYSHPRILTLMTNRAAILRDRGAFAEAEPVYRDLLRLREEHYPQDRMGRAYTLHGLGWILAETGSPDEAEDRLREMVGILAEEGDTRQSGRMQLGRSTLGRALALQGEFAAAEPYLVPALRWYRENNPRDGTVPIMAARVAELYEAWGRPVPGEVAPLLEADGDR